MATLLYLALAWLPTPAGAAPAPIYLPFLRQFAPGPPAAGTLRWVGEVGGPATEVAVAGNVAYLGEARHLAVVDVKDPTHPRRVREVGAFPDYVRDLAVSGDALFVAGGAFGLRVMGLADPLAPREIGSLDTPGSLDRVVISGTLAWLADGQGGLRSVDITDPAAPRPVGSLDTIQAAQSLAVQGGLAYVAVDDGRSRGLVVVDVSDPARPREIGSMPIPDSALDVAVEGGHAYVAAGEAGLVVVDVSDPTRPLASAVLEGIEVDDVVVADGRAFAASDTDVAVADLSRPGGPEWIGLIGDGAFLMDLALADGRLYAADEGWGLRVLDVSGAGLPSLLGQLDRPGILPNDVRIVGRHAYVFSSGGIAAGELASGFVVLDLTDPAAPVEVARLGWPGHAPRDLMIADGFGYVSDGGRNLQIYDLSPPESPRLVGLPRLPGELGHMTKVGHYGYVEDGLAYQHLVLDLSRPEAPRLAGHFDLGAAGLRDLAAVGPQSVLAAIHGNLYAMEASEPERPRLVGPGLKLGQVFGLQVVGSLAYVTDAGHEGEGFGLTVVDVSDPGQMRRVGATDLPSRGLGLAVANSVAYIAAGERGVHVVDVSRPAAPRWLTTVDTPDEAQMVAVTGGHAYVADPIGGLQIFRIDDGLRAPLRTANRSRDAERTAR